MVRRAVGDEDIIVRARQVQKAIGGDHEGPSCGPPNLT
jgi:hypothetical protein